jgi:hypothetical protein
MYTKEKQQWLVMGDSSSINRILNTSQDII